MWLSKLVEWQGVVLCLFCSTRVKEDEAKMLSAMMDLCFLGSPLSYKSLTSSCLVLFTDCYRSLTLSQSFILVQIAVPRLFQPEQ